MIHTVRITGWRYESGQRRSIRRINDKFEPYYEYDPFLVGWFCYASAGPFDVEKWMKVNMAKKYECNFKFNSGNPIYTIHITDPQDALLFKITYGVKDDDKIY